MTTCSFQIDLLGCELFEYLWFFEAILDKPQKKV